MGYGRERYNSKARGSVPGGGKKKKSSKQREQEQEQGQEQVQVHGGEGTVKAARGEVGDSNAEVIIPKSFGEREEERERERMRKEMLENVEGKMSSKKRKRLDNYIDKKLMKEERVAILQKLAQTQAQANSLTLQPTSSLGSRSGLTNAQKIAKLEDKETRLLFEGVPEGRGVNSKAAKRRRVVGTGSAWVGGESSGSEEEAEEEGEDAQEEEEVKDDELMKDGGEAENEKAIKVQRQMQKDAPVVEKDAVVVVEEEAYPEWTGFSNEADVNMAGEEEEDSQATISDDREGAEDKEDGESAEDEDSDDDSDDFDSEEEHEDEPDSASEDSDHPKRKRRKVTGFKEWAMQQLLASKNIEPRKTPPPEEPVSVPIDSPQTAKSKSKQKVHDPISGPLGEVLNLPTTAFAEHIRAQKTRPEDSSASASTSKDIPKSTPLKRHVIVNRTEEIQEARLQLPVVAEEQPIMEAVLLNPVVVICGETGSGKTTQIPQFLYEAGFGSPGSENPGMIGITQPRRVAAMSMASRVATELNLSPAEVSYQIRYDATVSPTTMIKFMTDGVLLRELATDFLLNRYSVVIVDEAHERSMNTDILIGVLSRVVRLREQMWRDGKDGIKPLRLIIMSATLRVTDFTANTALFKTPPPVITIAARQHPVTIHFSRRTVADYVNEAIKKTTKIHTRLPPGGILVFLTGQNEITGVCRKLETMYGREAIKAKKGRREHLNAAAKKRMEAVEKKAGAVAASEPASAVPSQVAIEAEDFDLGADADTDLAFDVDGDITADQLNPEALDSDDEAIGDDDMKIEDDSDMPMHIVPLYSLLPSEKQMKVFQTPPTDARLVVIATNVAETSLTIPGIRYVVDCGRAKERKYDVKNGIQSFQVSWISKASAAQRAGRAGRTGPGHCYRLYSSPLFENYFEQFAEPEILRVPIEGIVLQMKSMNIDVVVNFPFPTPPDRERLQNAEAILKHLGALESAAGSSHITNLGKTMALFPLSPRFSKMLVSGKQHGCLPYVIAIVSALSVGDPFLREEGMGPTDDKDKKKGEDDEDMPGALSHIRSEEVRQREAAKTRQRAFNNSQQMHASLGNSTSDIFRLLSVIGAYEFAGGGLDFCSQHFVRAKAMEEIHKLRSQITNIVNVNFPDMNIEFNPQTSPPSDLQLRVLRQLITAGFVDQVAVRKDLVDKSTSNPEKRGSSRNVPYRAIGVAEDVFVHPSSVLYHHNPPEYVVFHEIVKTSRPWIRTLTIINPAWLPTLAPTLCTMSKPMKLSVDVSVVIPKYGPQNWELPPIKQS
ncbi:hypothetical protein M422DRAFT_73568 [Sphaerobolus stellatus SS14]|nr:hypothetical protein M422DRAFT_73568 [Sphaerobolus stellatus SS14]